MSLRQITSQYSAKLLAQEAHTAQSISSAHSKALAALRPQIAMLLKQITTARSGDNPVTLAFLYTGNKLPNLKHAITQSVNGFAGEAQSQVLQLQHASVGLGQQSAMSQLGTFAQNAKTPQQKALDKIVGHTQQGKPISAIMSGFGEEAADRCGKALIAGVSIGQKPDVISRAIVVALAISLNRALVTEKTSAAEAFRSSTLATWQENEELTSGWLWTLGGPNPCPFCRSMAGKKFSLSENMISHPCCFCYMQIIVKGV